MRTPFVIVNFKTYKEGTGSKGVVLAKICAEVSAKTKKNIIIAVQAADIYRISKAVRIPVIAQHIDVKGYGSHTGAVTAEDVKESGAVGTLINHSERRIGLRKIKEAVLRAKENGLISVVCSPTARYEKKIIGLKPDFIAVEPPSLIGGKISVSKAKPELIKKSYNVLKGSKTRLIVGAGIHTKQDVATSIKLGAKGVLVASGIVKAKNPKKVLMEIVGAL